MIDKGRLKRAIKNAGLLLLIIVGGMLTIIAFALAFVWTANNVGLWLPFTVMLTILFIYLIVQFYKADSI